MELRVRRAKPADQRFGFVTRLLQPDAVLDARLVRQPHSEHGSAAAGAACPTSITATANYTSANQLSGYNYDLSGNLLADGIGNFFQYDANGMVKWASGASYVYDGEGNRVEKSGSSAMDTVYFGGRPIARLAGGAWTDLVHGAGGLLAEVPGTQAGAPVYRIADHLGTSVGTLAPGPPADPCLASNGCIVASIMDYASFGQVFAGSTSDPFKFTGKERDSESGLDNFGAHYYGSTMGRYMSPDPSGLYYADPTNPQSLNLYSYAQNSPLNKIDPTARECVWDDGSFDSVDDSETGNAAGCSGQGGTYVNPDLFENAQLTNGQQANYNRGDWSANANSTLQQSWVDPSANVYGATVHTHLWPPVLRIF